MGQFKGPHDSAGKVLPVEIKKRTSVGDDHAPDAEGAFLVGKKYKEHPPRAVVFEELEHGPHKNIERLQRFKGSRGLGHDEYFHGFVTTNLEQYERLSAAHPHVHFTPRTAEPQNITAIPASKKFRDFRSTEKDGELRYRDMPCRCESCQKEETCPYKHITGGWRTLSMDSNTSVKLLQFIGDDRRVERTFLEDGKVYVKGDDGNKKTLNSGTLVAFRGGDRVVMVGVIRTGGVVVYNLEEDGTTYTLPSTPVVEPVTPLKFIAATTKGKNGEVKSVTLSDGFRSIRDEVDEEVDEEEVDLAHVTGVGPEGIFDDGEVDGSDEEEGEDEVGGDSSDDDSDSDSDF